MYIWTWWTVVLCQKPNHCRKTFAPTKTHFTRNKSMHDMNNHIWTWETIAMVQHDVNPCINGHYETQKRLSNPRKPKLIPI